MPAGNDITIGDSKLVGGQIVGNTVGLRESVPEPLKDDNVNFRLDHNLTEKVKFFGRYMYHRDLTPNASGAFAGQIDLRSGRAVNTSASNLRGDGFTAGLDYQINNQVTNSFRAGWIRSRQDFTVIRPSSSAALLNLPETTSALGPVALAPGLGITGLIDTVNSLNYYFPNIPTVLTPGFGQSYLDLAQFLTSNPDLMGLLDTSLYGGKADGNIVWPDLETANMQVNMIRASLTPAPAARLSQRYGGPA